MIDAEMRGKLPIAESREDVLTSNVFGLLELVEHKGLIEILATARNINGETCEKLQNKHLKIENVELWKNFGGVEPDVFVTLEDGTQFVIEVKYYGGEHNKKVLEDGERTDKGQLRKYLDATQTDFLIYLTRNYRALKELSEDSRKKEAQIYHIHWEEFNEELKKVKNLQGCEKNIFEKLIDYLDFKGFEIWQGFQYRPEKYDIDLTNYANHEERGFYNDK